MSEPNDLPVGDDALAAPTADRSGFAGGTAVAASSMLGNLCGVLITLALARTYDSAQFGGLAALLGIGLVATVPATGLQYVVARRTAHRGLPKDIHDRGSIQQALIFGAGLSTLLAVVSPAMSSFLDLPTLAVIVVGLTVLPYMVNAVQLGTLLGHSSLARFALAQFVLAALRLGAVVTACAAHASTTGVVAALFLATLATVAVCAALTGVRTWTTSLPWDRERLMEIVRATAALAGISVVINIDIVLARHFLPPRESGTYALGSLFAKAALWAAQFVPQLIFARLAQTPNHRGLLVRAIIANVLVGFIVLVMAITAGQRVLSLVSTGEHGAADPVAAARLAPLFAVLGTAWSLCYLVLIASVATLNTKPMRMLWLVLAAETCAVVALWHHSAVEILATAIVASTLFAVTAAMALLRVSPAADGTPAVIAPAA